MVAAVILELLVDIRTNSVIPKCKGVLRKDLEFNDSRSGDPEEAEAASLRDGTGLLFLKLIWDCLVMGWRNEGGEEEYE